MRPVRIELAVHFVEAEGVASGDEAVDATGAAFETEEECMRLKREGVNGRWPRAQRRCIRREGKIRAARGP